MLDLPRQLLDGDFCGLVPPVLLLLTIAQYVVRNRPRLVRLSLGVAWLAFIAFLAAGLVLRTPTNGGRLFVLLLSGLSVAALTFGMVGLLSPGFVTGFDLLVRRPIGRMKRQRWERAQRRAEKLDAERKARERERSEREWEAARPERERARQAAEAERQQQLKEERQRDQKRFELQVLIDQHWQQLRQHLTGEQISLWFDQFLREDVPLGMFEQRVELIRQSITELISDPDNADAEADFSSIEEVLAHFAEKKQSIRDLETDDPDLIDTLVKVVEGEESRALERFLSSG